jgi:plasmid stabilization system protein ParE
MKYEISIAKSALRDLDSLFNWLAPLNPNAAERHKQGVVETIERELRYHPKIFAHFWITGPPFRARLYHVSHRTKFWIVYHINGQRGVVTVVRLWNASRDPSKFES